MGSRWLAGAALALALFACGDDGGPIGSGGGRDGVELRYVTPRIQVVPVGSRSRVTLSFRARRADAEGDLVPWGDATFEVHRESGAARAETSRVTTDDQGVATVVAETDGSADQSEFLFLLVGDRRQHLSFDVVTAPARTIAPGVGEVAEVDLAPEGVLLRFPLSGTGRMAFVPYQLDPERGGIAYRLLNQGAGLDPSAVAFGANPPAVPRSRPAVVLEDRGHVVPGALDVGGLVPSAALAPSMNVRSCRVDVDRQAPLRYAGREVAIYVDAPPDRWQARIDSLGRAFDDHIVPVNTSLFGETTDLDGNGVVLVVMTPELVEAGGTYCDGIRSSRTEVFYAKWNPADPIAAPLATLAHEHQHVINASHHLRTRGEVGDERWLNEGLSYVAETKNAYWRSPLVRVWQFLNGQNGGVSMFPFQFDGAFADEYQMFFLYLGDRFGEGAYLRLEENGRAGVPNVEHVTRVPFDSLMRDWFVANALNGQGLEVPPRYRYTTIDFGGMADEIAACECVPKTVFEGMSMERLYLNQPFDVFRSMEGYDADYYEVVPEPGTAVRTYELYVDGFGRASTRLAVARLR